MKTNKCVSCDNKTFQKDHVCVVCRIGLTGIYSELEELLKKTGKGDLRTVKISGIR